MLYEALLAQDANRAIILCDADGKVVARHDPKFMCMGAPPPQDHPHVFCDMGNDVEYVCPYCSTLCRHNPALAPNQARPAECEFYNAS